MIKRFVVLLFAIAFIANGTFFLISPNFDASVWKVILGWTLFFVSFGLSFVWTPIIIKLALLLNFVDKPQGRKSHTKITPLGGGIPIFLAVSTIVLGGLLCIYALKWFPNLFPFPSFLKQIPSQLTIHYDGVLSESYRALVIMGGGFILFLTGLIDDKIAIPAKIKLLIQICVAVLLASNQITIKILEPYWYLTFPVTILWIVGITNAFNLLDNMDGLSSGVLFICSLNLLIVCLNTGQLFVGSLLIVLMGANLGFLIYNFPPAKIFMGDGGSLFMGYMLATCTVLCSAYQDSYPLYPIIVPILILSVPIYDTFSVIVIRLKSGYSIFRADQNHFSHRLVELGFSRPTAVFFIYLVTFATGITATLLEQLDLRGGIIIALQILCTITIIALLESIGKKSLETTKIKKDKKN